MRTGLLTLIAATAVVLCGMTGAARSQSAPAAADPAVMAEATAVANACLASWTSADCLKNVSSGAMVLASNYGSALQQGGHPGEAEQVKQHCAASTAATQGTYPAYAMRSAFTECVNAITDISAKTGMAPDPTQFQLLVGPTLCLSGDARCAAVTDGMRRFATH